MIYGDSQNILWNLKLLLDSVFLRDGHFRNVSRGLSIRSVDVSRLARDSSSDSYFAGISGAQVWQSPYKEWVYESGITMNDAPFISGMTPPAAPSGVWVNGTFFSNGTGVSGSQFYIDYMNGRVIFNGTGIPNNSNLQVNYSYRTFRVDFSNRFARADIEYHAETELKDNPYTNDNVLYPSGGAQVGILPAIFLELDEDDREAFELGNRSAIVTQPVFCHVYAYSPVERDAAMDLIRSRWHIQMPLIDFNYAPFPLSGLMATMSPNYIPYQTLLTNVTHNGQKVISKTFTFEDVRGRPQEPLLRLERGVVTVTTKIYNISPTGRIPQNPYI